MQSFIHAWIVKRDKGTNSTIDHNLDEEPSFAAEAPSCGRNKKRKKENKIMKKERKNKRKTNLMARKKLKSKKKRYDEPLRFFFLRLLSLLFYFSFHLLMLIHPCFKWHPPLFLSIFPIFFLGVFLHRLLFSSHHLPSWLHMQYVTLLFTYRLIYDILFLILVAFFLLTLSGSFFSLSL